MILKKDEIYYTQDREFTIFFDGKILKIIDENNGGVLHVSNANGERLFLDEIDDGTGYHKLRSLF